ncbi:hypothetical protein GCM10020218_000230 [Dactylosporangium vinaceum]
MAMHMNIRSSSWLGRVITAAATLVVATMVVLVPGPAAQADTPNSVIGVRYSDWLTSGYRCLDVRQQDGPLQPNARIQLWSCSGALEQQWRSHLYGYAPPAGEFGIQRALYQIINLRSQQCMEVRDGSTASGAAVDQYPCGSGSIDAIAAQLWMVTPVTSPPGWPTYNVSPYSAYRVGLYKCLDAMGGQTGNGTMIQQWTCTGRSNQQLVSWGTLLAS